MSNFVSRRRRNLKFLQSVDDTLPVKEVLSELHKNQIFRNFENVGLEVRSFMQVQVLKISPIYVKKWKFQ